MYLPASICVTSLAGKDEKPGPTMHSWSIARTAEQLATSQGAPFNKLEMLVVQMDNDIAGIANVKTNEDITIEADNVGLPCCDGAAPSAK